MSQQCQWYLRIIWLNIQQLTCRHCSKFSVMPMPISTSQNSSTVSPFIQALIVSDVCWITMSLLSQLAQFVYSMCGHIYFTFIANLYGMQWVTPCLIIVLTVVHHTHEPRQYTGVHGTFRVYMELGDQSGQMRVNDRYLHTHIIFPSTKLAILIYVGLAQAHSNNVCVCVCVVTLCAYAQQGYAFGRVSLYIYIYVYIYIYFFFF